MTNVNSKIGKLIRQRRIKMNLTQYDLAKIIVYNITQFVSLFERGISKVPYDTLGILITKLDLPENKIKQALLDEFSEQLNSSIEDGKNKIQKRKPGTNPC